MENREILVANTKTQKRSRIITSATTLGELKAAFDDAGIDYSGMTFTEGISKTQLIDNDTQLPHDIMYKGALTNNLVILLTNTKKNIASGIMSRSEAYQAVKDNNLQDAIKNAFGRNFTQVPTADLLAFLNSHTLHGEASQEDAGNMHDSNVSCEENDYDEEDEGLNYSLSDYIENARIESLSDSLLVHIAMLAKNKSLAVSDVRNLRDGLGDVIDIMQKESKRTQAPVSTSDGTINDDDIDSMIDSLV